MWSPFPFTRFLRSNPTHTHTHALWRRAIYNKSLLVYVYWGFMCGCGALFKSHLLCGIWAHQLGALLRTQREGWHSTSQQQQQLLWPPRSHTLTPLSEQSRLIAYEIYFAPRQHIYPACALKHALWLQSNPHPHNTQKRVKKRFAPSRNGGGDSHPAHYVDNSTNWIFALKHFFTICSHTF